MLCNKRSKSFSMSVFYSSVTSQQTHVQDDLLQSLDLLYLDTYLSNVCAAQYMFGHVYRSSTLYLYFGVIFIRMILIRHAENIRTDNMSPKTHQARLSIIGGIVLGLILSLMASLIINLMLFPQFPFEFLLVRNCRGIQTLYSSEEIEKIKKGWSVDLVGLMLLLVATMFFHLRVCLTKRRQHISKFSQNRQNIATLDQTLAASYLKLVLAIMETFSFLLILNNSPYKIYNTPLLVATNTLNCIAVPAYWTYSASTHFQDLSSHQILFSRKLTSHNSVNASRGVLEPRRPTNQHISGEQYSKGGEGFRPGKFSYIFKEANIVPN